ncbi:MAG: transposase, partial [Gammaproteobacteria bacterium]|nr:transposase [Gammaproteobacteria bacterium]
LHYAFYRPKNAVGKTFKTKLEQAVELIDSVASTWKGLPLLVVTDSWFGNRGLFKPLRERLGHRVDVLSRLRTNINLFDLPKPKRAKRRGAPRKYGKKRGNVRTLARRLKRTAQSRQVNLYGKRREVQVVSQCFMLKTLKCPVRVVWVYHRTQWVALFTTDLTLSVEQIISTYGARWKIEAAFKELKHDLGSTHGQATTFTAVTNHWHFAMMAMTLAWIYAARLPEKPQHRHSSKTIIHFTFSDL